MDGRQANSMAKQLADECIRSMQSEHDIASLNLAGHARLNNWELIGAGSSSGLTTIQGEPVILKVIIQFDQPRYNREDNQFSDV